MTPLLSSTAARGLALLLAIAPAACGDDDDDHDHMGDDGDDADDDADDDGPDAGTGALADTLFVAREGSLVSFDIATGEERPGTITDVTGPTDVQALADGNLMVNLTGRNEILIFDGRTMLEEARLPSSAGGGVRPVHSFLSPSYDGQQYWLTTNDGEGAPAENTACLVDVTGGSDTRFDVVAEFPLGIGHHKASFSKTRPRVVISNISDCENVMSVYDFSDPTDVQVLATLDGAAAGFGGEDPGEGEFNPTFCDPTYQRGLPPAPHGCATSPQSGKAYCSITSSGAVVAVDIDADEPTFTLLPTEGSGGGYTFAHDGGRYLYTVLELPREGGTGAACEIGAIAITDTMDDTIAATVPLKYSGPDCEEALTGTPAVSAYGGHSYFAADGDLLFITVSGGFDVADARVDQLLVFDTSDPAAPVQLPSIQVGVHTSHSAGALSGDGSTLFVVNAIDNTVSQIDVATRAVTRTLDVGEGPRTLTTFGTEEGPGHQTGPVE